MGKHRTIAERVHTSALKVMGRELKQKGIVMLARPVAKERAKELRQLGYNCRIKDEYTIKKLNKKKKLSVTR